MNLQERINQGSDLIRPTRVVERYATRTGQAITAQQIETAGKTYTSAAVKIAALHALIDAARVMGRTIWKLAVIASVGTAALWLHLHWASVLRWLH